MDKYRYYCMYVVSTVGVHLILALKTPIHGHGEGELWGLAVHPAALSFVTASDDKTVRLWNLSSKVCSPTITCMLYSMLIESITSY